jgi:hypothetical protein
MQVTCLHCKKTFELSDALASDYKESLTEELLVKHKQDLEKTKKEALENSSKKLREEFELQLKRTGEDLEEKDERIKKLIEDMSDLTKELRTSKKEKDEAKLEMEKKLAEEEDKIRLDATKKAQEEQHTILMAKEKQLQDALKEAEDMKRKLSQGSQQSQGEVFELEFEENLLERYPHDTVSPVGKGIKGGDIVQEVIDAHGNYAGKILWELKNTKTWSEGWIDKLKTDKRAITGDEAVIISEILPTDMKVAGFRNGVWVTQPAFAFSLCDTIRVRLIQLQQVKNASKGKDTKMEILYAYLSGTEFKNRVEAIVESFSSMQQEIEKEKRYFSNKWARDEKAIRQVIDNTIGMHGDLKGIIGNSLPIIKDLELLGDGEN